MEKEAWEAFYCTATSESLLDPGTAEWGAMIALITDRLNEHKCHSVLDIGCGTSRLAPALASRWYVAGIDYSCAAIAKLQHLYSGVSHLEFWEMDARSMSFIETHHFDCVIAKDTLRCIPSADIPAVLTQIDINLAHTGILLLIERRSTMLHTLASFPSAVDSTVALIPHTDPDDPLLLLTCSAAASTIPLSRLRHRIASAAARPRPLSPSRLARLKALRSRRDARETCTLCYDRRIDACLVPCGHLCLCYDCAATLASKTAPNCPLCRQRYVRVLKVDRCVAPPVEAG